MTRKHAISRRTFTGWAAASLAVPAGLARAQDEGWPKRPIRLVVGYAPGGSTDITARLLADALSRRLGQPITVINTPGASGTIAAQQVARAEPDGYTFLACASPEMAVVPLTTKLPYDPLTDLAPVSLIARLPYLLVTHPSVPASNMQEFIAHARGNPGRLNFFSSGNHTSNHIASELFLDAAKLTAVHVPYKGTGQAVTDLIAGQVQFALDTATALKPHVDGGKMRALGVTSEQRLASAPDIPTFREASGIPFAAGTWVGVVGPAATPKPVIERLNAEISAVLADPAMRRNLQDKHMLLAGGSPADFAGFIRKELEERRLAMSKLKGLQLK